MLLQGMSVIPSKQSFIDTRRSPTMRDGILGMITVYRPSGNNGSIVDSLRRSFFDIRVARFFIWKMFIRDFKAQHRKSILGYLWAFITPIAAAATYVLLNSVGVLNPGDTQVPYPLFLFVGISIWNTFSAIIMSVGGGLSSQGDLLLKTNIPKLSLAIIPIAQVMYSAIVQMMIITVLMLIYKTKVGASGLLLFLPSLAPILILGLSIGLILSIVSSIANDFTGVARIILSGAMYLTPVIFTFASIDNPLMQIVMSYNPLTYLLSVPRSLILGTNLDFISQFMASTVLSLLWLAGSIHFFYCAEHLVSERI